MSASGARLADIPQNAEAFARDAKPWFALLRERYKAKFVEACENRGPDFAAEIEKLAAKIAVIADIENEIAPLIANRQIAKHFEKKKG
jgi:hypothetical protein